MTKESQPFNILVAGEKASKLPVRLDCDSKAPLGEGILKQLRSTKNYAQRPVMVVTASTLLRMELQDRDQNESK